jgi:cytochrome bd-type quinol oxidase subunit 1
VSKLAMTLSGATGLAACLLIHGATEEISSEPRLWHQAAKSSRPPLILFGIPNSAEKRVDYAVEIPKGSSLILKHDPDAPLAGLDTVADDLKPPVAVVF